MTYPQRELLRKLARPDFFAEAQSYTSATVRDAGRGYEGVAFGPSLAKLERLGYLTVSRHRLVQQGFHEDMDHHRRRACGTL